MNCQTVTMSTDTVLLITVKVRDACQLTLTCGFYSTYHTNLIYMTFIQTVDHQASENIMTGCGILSDLYVLFSSSVVVF